jgi:hypothetical protein
METLKSFFQFMWSGILTMLAYVIYTVLIIILTVGAGFPVAIGAAILVEITNRLLNGVF